MTFPPSAALRLALCAGLLLPAGTRALAHAKLVSAEPPADAVAKVAPQNLDLLFNEKISEKLSGATIKDAAGAAVPASLMLEKAGKGLMVMMPRPLKPGVYTVTWHAVASDDGHRTEGAYTFTVN